MNDASIICSGCSQELDLNAENIWMLDLRMVAAPHTDHIEDLPLDEIQSQWKELVEEMQEASESSPNDALRQIARRQIHYLCNPCAEKFEDDPFRGLEP